MKVGLLHKGSLFGKVGLGKSVGEVLPPILKDGNTEAMYDYLDLSTITKDGSDFMSEMRDFFGSGHDLLQAVGTNQPLWTSDGILFDGIDNFMKTLPFTFGQPEQIYLVFKQITWTATDRIFDGNIKDTGTMFQTVSSPRLRSYSGIVSDSNGDLALNTFGIITILFDGVNSSFQVDDETPVTGDFGVFDMGGFTLGGGADMEFYSHILFKGGILRKIGDTSPNKQIIKDYLKTKYSI